MVRVWLRDDQFGRIEALLPGKVSDPGRTAANNRLFVEAVLWIARTGSPWRDLPCEFGPWNSVYQRFARWSRQGLWHQLFAKLAVVLHQRRREVLGEADGQPGLAQLDDEAVQQRQHRRAADGELLDHQRARFRLTSTP